MQTGYAGWLRRDLSLLNAAYAAALGWHVVRQLAGDWGDVDEHDRRENELSLIHGFRLLSAIITEADCSVTTLLLSDEY
jgi:hypothetical protein